MCPLVPLDAPGAGVRGSYKLPNENAGLDLRSLEEQQALLTTETTLQLLKQFYFNFTS